MSYWNHRVLRSVDASGDTIFAIHEVHYRDGKPAMCTENPVVVLSENLDDLRKQLEQMLSCLDRPVLDITQFDAPKPHSAANA